MWFSIANPTLIRGLNENVGSVFDTNEQRFNFLEIPRRLRTVNAAEFNVRPQISLSGKKRPFNRRNLHSIGYLNLSYRDNG